MLPSVIEPQPLQSQNGVYAVPVLANMLNEICQPPTIPLTSLDMPEK